MDDASVIAVVDDDESVRMALASLLRSVGFVVLLFASAEEFLRRQDVPPITCLILDVRMPGIDGLQLQKHLRNNGWRIPIIFLTAHGHDNARAASVAGGATAFLPKPFDADVLLNAVRSVVEAK
ncbi:MAG: response regulator receiver protein [Acidobacteria bacterium]|nr:response regulator receiver protein [Acidobacteriota bacterium]